MTAGQEGARGGGSVVLLVAIAAASVCALVYELLAGALSSYLLGDSVAQFSVVIGVFLSGMGVGSYLSQFVRRDLVAWFIGVEVAVGVLGGTSGLAGFAAFAYTEAYQAVLVAWTAAIGVLIGLEIPLVLRILRARTRLRVSVANVLAADYIGALLASVLFPFLLVPSLGLVQGGLVMGLANVAVAAVALWVLRPELDAGAARRLWPVVGGAAAALALAAVLATGWVAGMEDRLYQDEIVFAQDTPFQRIVLTRWRGDLRLYLDGNLQLASADEHRYHEALVHPALGLVGVPRRVLILGGGDGMAAREVLRHRGVERVDLVDLDPAVTRLFSTRAPLQELNGDSLNDPRVTVHNEDAWKYLERYAGAPYDAILADLPDPNTLALGKLYTQAFYRLAVRHLALSGALVTQATSPFMTREAFWCIVRTLRSTETPGGKRLSVYPYSASVPSFGEWGFALATLHPRDPTTASLQVPTRYLTPELLPLLFALPGDVAEVETPVNRLENQALVRLYESGARRFFD